MNIKEKFISRPNPYVVLGIFILSAAWIAFNVVNYEPVELSSNNIFEGRVVKVISEKEKPALSGVRTNIEQELLAEIYFSGNKKELKEVLNDFIPLRAGDEIYIQASVPGEAEESYYVIDIKRTSGMLWLAALFVILVWMVSGKRGIYALVGLMFSFAVIFLYIIPGILGGGNAIATGLSGAILILIVALYVSHGFNRKSISAFLGISITLCVVGLLANYSIGQLHFSGFSGEESVYLNSQTDNSLNLIGLLVTGIIIAVIGILDDVAVTQASTVFRLSSNNKDLRGWELFKESMEVGRDHISAVINTLILAYTGAALPLLLLLTINKFPIGFVVNGEIVSEEIVRTLISSSGLVLAVPITTLVAVWLKERDY